MALAYVKLTKKQNKTNNKNKNSQYKQVCVCDLPVALALRGGP